MVVGCIAEKCLVRLAVFRLVCLECLLHNGSEYSEQARAAGSRVSEADTIPVCSIYSEEKLAALLLTHKKIQSYEAMLPM